MALHRPSVAADEALGQVVKQNPIGLLLAALFALVFVLVMVNTLLPDLWWHYIRNR